MAPSLSRAGDPAAWSPNAGWSPLSPSGLTMTPSEQVKARGACAPGRGPPREHCTQGREHMACGPCRDRGATGCGMCLLSSQVGQRLVPEVRSSPGYGSKGPSRVTSGSAGYIVLH